MVGAGTVARGGSSDGPFEVVECPRAVDERAVVGGRTADEDGADAVVRDAGGAGRCADDVVDVRGPGSPSSRPIRRTAATRRVSRAWVRSWVRAYIRARPSVVSAARTTTGIRSTASGPRRRPRHTAAATATRASSARPLGTHGGASSPSVGAASGAPTVGVYQVSRSSEPSRPRASAAFPAVVIVSLRNADVVPTRVTSPPGVAARTRPQARSAPLPDGAQRSASGSSTV
ncbi:hypothetical protein QP157_11520 [Sphingomonas sp. LR61]